MANIKVKNVDEKIYEYEENLRKAEADIEAALRSICSLRGPFPRYDLNEALDKVRDSIRGVFRLYGNDAVEFDHA